MSTPNQAILGPYGVYNVNSHSSPHTFHQTQPGMADRCASKPASIDIVSIAPDGLAMEFEMVGTCAPIANMIRRVMMQEVPTVAPEIVAYETNTSVLQDENLAARIGLVPIKVNPKLLDFPQDEDWMTNPRVCLHFELDVTGTQDNELLTSGQLRWIPLGNQEQLLADDPPRPVVGDIVLLKIKPGQRVLAQIYCCKGTAVTHSKYSPCCPASYRMMPKVELCTPQGVPTRITGEEAQKVKAMCPKNVFDIEDTGELVVSRDRDCTMCRECVRLDNRCNTIRLSRLKDHFIFSVESTGVYQAKDIVREALRLYQFKCQDLVQHVATGKAVFAESMEGVNL